MREKPSLTVYHDGTCPLCAAEIALYQRARGAEAVMFLDAAAPDTEAELGPGLSREAVLARFHVRDGNGILVSGAAAFTALWCTLPGWRWLGRVVGAADLAPGRVGLPCLPAASTLHRASADPHPPRFCVSARPARLMITFSADLVWLALVQRQGATDLSSPGSSAPSSQT